MTSKDATHGLDLEAVDRPVLAVVEVSVSAVDREIGVRQRSAWHEILMIGSFGRYSIYMLGVELKNKTHTHKISA